jgi:N6-adenosine-specific RNA methylase IME4
VSKKIELFARQRVPGWDCWGNEVPSENEEEAIK